MIYAPDLAEWNRQTVALVQALLGAISPNFRMVSLNYINECWSIRIVLSNDDSEDRSEIAEIISEFEALQDGPISCKIDIDIESGVLAWPSPPERVVFRRREK
jgi:hypothetical protein